MWRMKQRRDQQRFCRGFGVTQRMTGDSHLGKIGRD